VFLLGIIAVCRDMAQDPVRLKEFIVSKSRNISNIPEASNLLERTKLDSICLVPLRFRLPWDILVKDITRRGICVAGDALHPMTPDIGQGGCSALEDSVVLARCIGESFLKVPESVIRNEEDDREITATINKGLENFAKLRKWRSFNLVAVAYLASFGQENDNKILRFLRKNFMKRAIASVLKMADFDCGKLSLH
jgi:2-polyprenyl-6-methoxyphenol hydroxylase-like FAD-dependent oxidoreductase